ncbi:MAG: UDP-glucose 4-epimerase GalE [Trueperaceae bacterium]|nr:MAG: UDP-glucose 4-epimerase GalE [Trueperaceae bacterium]
MHVLVTGGAGYIGSVTVEVLLERGHRVTVLDHLVNGHRQAVHPEARFVRGDIADEELVARILQGDDIEAVMHFAASTLVGESMERPIEYFENNTAKTLTLLKILLEHGVKKFVLSSTAALFGTPEIVPIPEDAPVRPGSVYGESKYLVERMLRWFSETEGLGYVSLRYFNAAGASRLFGEDHRPETHLIPLVLQVASGKRDSITIFGDDYPTPDGSCIRDYIHVLDLAQAHVLALEALVPGQARAFNLGNGLGFSVKQVIEHCLEVTGHAIPVRIGVRRAGDPAVLVADSRLIKEELGWQPQFPDLLDIITSAWAWHRAHPRGYDA